MGGIVLRGGTVVDPVAGMQIGDVEIIDGVITRIGSFESTLPELDVSGRLVLPGSIDTHSHADARILDEDVQLALLRQGVTSVIVGQDGVSFAPGNGEYAREYFGALNGEHPSYRGGGVAGLLDTYTGRTRVNVGYLIPAGTIRHEEMGSDPSPATARQLASMVDAVRAGMADGALGLSSGLDYVPGCFADAGELAALCAPVAASSGVYVTHMRGYEENSGIGFAELEQICALSGVAAHVSHFHAREAIVSELMAAAAEHGHNVTFDAYPYFRGCTILSMALLPKDLIARGNSEAGRILRDPQQRQSLLDGWHAEHVLTEGMGQEWAGRMLVASAGSAEWAWTEGHTIAAAAVEASLEPGELAFRMLGDSSLAVTVVMEIRKPRTNDELARQFSHPAAMCGSDGIFLGSSPHPRGWGCFARMMGLFVRERGDFDWAEITDLMARRPAERFGLAGRGRVTVGSVADLIVVDPEIVGDTAWYDAPTALAVGISHVLVNGSVVLEDGELSSSLAGVGLRHAGVL